MADLNDLTVIDIAADVAILVRDGDDIDDVSYGAEYNRSTDTVTVTVSTADSSDIRTFELLVRELVAKPAAVATPEVS
jgi:hypothetical protein